MIFSITFLFFIALGAAIIEKKSLIKQVYKDKKEDLNIFTLGEKSITISIKATYLFLILQNSSSNLICTDKNRFLNF